MLRRYKKNIHLREEKKLIISVLKQFNSLEPFITTVENIFFFVRRKHPIEKNCKKRTRSKT